MINQHEKRKREAGFNNTIAELRDTPMHEGIEDITGSQSQLKTFIRKSNTRRLVNKELEAISEVSEEMVDLNPSRPVTETASNEPKPQIQHAVEVDPIE